VGILVLAGMLFTFWDYYKYWKIENSNYGHGPGQAAATWNLDQLYQNELVKIRIKYPKDLEAKTQGLKDTETVEFNNGEVSVSVRARNETGTLKDLEDKEIANLAKNEQMYGERSYENTERVNMTVINFQRFVGDKTYMVSRYLAKKGDKLFVVEFSTELINWQKNQPNFREMARTLVLL